MVNARLKCSNEPCRWIFLNVLPHDLAQRSRKMACAPAAFLFAVEIATQNDIPGPIGTLKRVAAIFFKERSDGVEKFLLVHADLTMSGEEVKGHASLCGCRGQSRDHGIEGRSIMMHKDRLERDACLEAGKSGNGVRWRAALIIDEP